MQQVGLSVPMVTGVVFSLQVRKAIKEAKEEIALLRMREIFDKFSNLVHEGDTSPRSLTGRVSSQVFEKEDTAVTPTQ